MRIYRLQLTRLNLLNRQIKFRKYECFVSQIRYFSNSQDDTRRAISTTRKVVSNINSVWEQHPLSSVCSFLLLDVGGLAVFYKCIQISEYSPTAELVLAFGIARMLKRFRIPFDLSLAFSLSKLFPIISELQIAKLLGSDKLGTVAEYSSSKIVYTCKTENIIVFFIIK
jgi:hypothetical protein